MKKYGEFIILPSVLLIAAGVLTGCNDKGDETAQAPAPQVNVYTVKAEPLAVTTELPGRTDAYRVAEVRPQVSGIILKRKFVEGGQITAGESLYQIDPATYLAAMNSAQADLAKAQAAANIAHLTVKRYLPLLGTKYISRQEYDQSVASAQQADAEVKAARAAFESARINVAYTNVQSPISGLIGKSNVTEGALVTNGQASSLATVQQLDPIYVDVTQSSNDFMQLKQSIEQGSLQKTNGKTSVQLMMEDGQPYALQGVLEFSDVTVDQTTGSITLRAVFPNPQHQLLPGMYVRAKIDQGVQPAAMLVPQQGLTRTPRGEATVLVVDENNKAQVREVTAPQAFGDKWLVTKGVKPGDKIIVSGLQRVHPGAAVQIVPDSAAAQTR